MAALNYRDGIAILQLIVFPIVFVTALIIWRRAGWKAGGKSWRFIVTLSLLRIAGSICTLLTISNHTENIYIAEAVCELMGIAPLVLTYVGLLGQIDVENLLPPRLIRVVTLLGFIGLILGIAGVSITDNTSPYRPNSEVKAAMGIFLAVFVAMTLMTVYLAFQLSTTMRSWQKKLFLAIILSWPFLLVRMIYSAVGDYTTNSDFAIFGGNNTIYLCMNVLEEIIVMAICVVFGISAMKDKQREQVFRAEMNSGPKTEQV